MSREPVQEPDKTFMEISFKRIARDNVRTDEWDRLKSIQNYYELDGCLSPKQIAEVRRLKGKHDRAQRDKSQYDAHGNREHRLNLIYNPAKPF